MFNSWLFNCRLICPNGKWDWMLPLLLFFSLFWYRLFLSHAVSLQGIEKQQSEPIGKHEVKDDAHRSIGEPCIFYVGVLTLNEYRSMSRMVTTCDGNIVHQIEHLQRINNACSRALSPILCVRVFYLSFSHILQQQHCT